MAKNATFRPCVSLTSLRYHVEWIEGAVRFIGDHNPEKKAVGPRAWPTACATEHKLRVRTCLWKESTMLVLSRKKNESIIINDDITIVVVEIRGDKVRLGVEAPKEVPVHRNEVYEAIRRNQQKPDETLAQNDGNSPS